jgi:hypothetical protein
MRLVDINSISPSTYNPRESDPERLKLVEYSLRKLGFVLPLYVCKQTGEILSGHQRHYVSQKMGLKQVPVEFVKPMSLEKRKAYNIVFNRGTNDLQRDETSKTIAEQLKTYNLDSLIENTPDVVDFYPCMKTVKIDAKEIAKVNMSAKNKYAYNMARTLSRIIDYMPVIITKDLKVINGIGRLFHQLEKGATEIDCVIIPDEKAKLAYAMLNLVSMDFNLHKKYEDDLRFNSFRRSLTTRRGLGRGFVVGAFGKTRSLDFKELKGNNLSAWVNKYGTNIVDFGAGRFTDTKILREAGLNVYSFEPYICKEHSNDIDRQKSVETTIDFLKAVESGEKFDSIFISSVLNSVPFFEDRLHIVTICSALCNHDTLLTIWAMNRNANAFRTNQNSYVSKTESNMNHFKLDYEDNILLGGFNDKPKVQKFHTKKELFDLLKNSFNDIKIKLYGDNYLVEARNPKINIERLRLALEFEFNLPYPDGKRMNLVHEAKLAFSKRLGVEL